MVFQFEEINYTILNKRRRTVGTGNYSNNGANAVISNFGPNLNIPEQVQDENGNYYRVTEIGPSSFEFCLNIIHVFVPSSIEIIRRRGFIFLRNCETFVFANNSHLKIVEQHGLYDMYKIKSLVFTSNCLKELGESSISYALVLQTLVLPSSITKIEAHSLCGMEQIKSIYYCGSVFQGDVISSHTVKNSKTNESAKIFVSNNYHHSTFGNREDFEFADEEICRHKTNICSSVIETCMKRYNSLKHESLLLAILLMVN